MPSNRNLRQANRAKKDEFYTRFQDIVNELSHYRDSFREKTVYCNCDDPYDSNFFRYFVLNFNSLGLRRLIATCYGGVQAHGSDVCGGSESGIVRRIARKIVIDEVADRGGDGAVDHADVEWLLRNGKNVMEPLAGDGDFRSAECVELLMQADVVVTNPPFSLFREYIAQLVEYGKKFLVIGNQNAIAYKEIFPLIRENRMWLGYGFKGGAAHFHSHYRDVASSGGHREGMIRVSGVAWFTNMDTSKRHRDLPLHRRYTLEEYPKYDNCDAINVDRVCDIPCDYDGVMGVPITFLDKYNPEQFEIVEFRRDMKGRQFACGASDGMDATLLQNTLPSMQTGGLMNSPKDTRIDGRSRYARILIRRIKK